MYACSEEKKVNQFDSGEMAKKDGELGRKKEPFLATLQR